MKQRMEAGAET